MFLPHSILAQQYSPLGSQINLCTWQIRCGHPILLNPLHLKTLQWVPIKLRIKPKPLPQPKGTNVILASVLLPFVSFSLSSGHCPPACKAYQHLKSDFTSKPSSIYNGPPQSFSYHTVCLLLLTWSYLFIILNTGYLFTAFLPLMKCFFRCLQNVNLHARRVFGLSVTTESPGYSSEHRSRLSYYLLNEHMGSA